MQLDPTWSRSVVYVQTLAKSILRVHINYIHKTLKTQHSIEGAMIPNDNFLYCEAHG